jgi:hypothetical protein
VVSVIPSVSPITDANQGAGNFTLTIVYSEPMNTGVNPDIVFTPDVNTTLENASPSWTDGVTCVVTYDVTDVEVNVVGVDVLVENAQDENTNVQVSSLNENIFSIDTKIVKAVPGVPDFSISVSPTSGSVAQGGSTSVTVSVSSIEGFSETVSLSASGLPSGATASFSPTSGTPSFTSSLTISTASTTLAGIYTITITGTRGGKIHDCTYILIVTPAAVPPEKFPWELVTGIIAAIVIVTVIVALLYKRH